MKLLQKALLCILTTVVIAFTIPVTSSAAIQWTPKENPVSSTKEWKITFSHSVDSNTISTDTVYILDDKGNKQAVQAKRLASDPRVLVVPSPARGYTAGNDYTLHIEKSIQSINGKMLTDGIEMKFTIESPSEQPGEESGVVGTWNGEYLGIIFQATFNKNLTSVVTLDGQVEKGVYSISGDQMTVSLLGTTRTGRVNQLSANEFTITSASGKIMRFTK
ncbi:hypothetical protein CSV79_08785 [Sporosarcina sp. P13]|nr:hypothetical protein CSV79_08785 [Sporosarcina sp. P13]